MLNKIYNNFKIINSDNPMELAREIVAPLCYNKLKEHIINCKDCRFRSDERKLPYGNYNANILIINDNASNDKDIEDYFNYLLEESNIDKDDIFIINSVSCLCTRKDKDDTLVPRLPSLKEAQKCKSFIDYTIDFIKPRIIFSMGATAVNQFIPNTNLIKTNGSTVEFNGVKAIISYSVKDLFDLSAYKSEEEITELTTEIIDNLNKAQTYINNIK